MNGKRGQSRESNLALKYKAQGQGTTVMIRNIPVEYTQDELIFEVSQSMGSADLFDFFYLPWDSTNNCNVGYAFVNFHNSGIAQKAVRVFSSYKFRVHESSKVGQVSPAHIQGLENNLRHLQDRAVVHGNLPYSPVVMWKGQKIELSVIFQELKTQDTLNKFREGAAPMTASAPSSVDGSCAPVQAAQAPLSTDSAQDLRAEMVHVAANQQLALPHGDLSGMVTDSSSHLSAATSAGGGIDDLFENDEEPLPQNEQLLPGVLSPFSAPVGVKRAMTLSQRFGITGPLKPMSSRGVRRGPLSMTSLPVVFDTGESNASNSETASVADPSSNLSAKPPGLAPPEPFDGAGLNSAPVKVSAGGGVFASPIIQGAHIGNAHSHSLVGRGQDSDRLSVSEVATRPPPPKAPAPPPPAAAGSTPTMSKPFHPAVVADGVPMYSPAIFTADKIPELLAPCMDPEPPLILEQGAKDISVQSAQDDVLQKFLKRFGD